MAYGSVNVPGKPWNTSPDAVTVPSGGVIIPPALSGLAGGPWEFELTSEEEDVSQLNLSIDQILELRNVLSTFALRTQLRSLNLLDNWYFIGGGSQQGGGQFPINQRGQTSYIAQGYTIDRWARRGTGVTEEDTQKIITAVTESGVKISAPESANISGGYHDFSQRIENYKDLLGKTVTVSLFIDDLENVSAINFGLYSSNGAFVNSTPLCRGYGGLDKGLYTATATIPESIVHSGINFCIRSWMNEGGGYFVLRAAKLELGSVQTLAHQDEDGNWVLNDPPPDKVLELAKCQRYQVFGNLIAFPVLKNAASNGYWSFLPISTPMAKNPAVIGNPEFVTADGNKLADGITAGVTSIFENGVLLRTNSATGPVVIEGTWGLDANL